MCIVDAVDALVVIKEMIAFGEDCLEMEFGDAVQQVKYFPIPYSSKGNISVHTPYIHPHYGFPSQKIYRKSDLELNKSIKPIQKAN